mmetsp:Transcript_51292/g.133225  ORF Transcript_51292/g.133225 Transcript_51292/m.133225 type:complete len:214 (+) Transcript_51292:100-741(+)
MAVAICCASVLLGFLPGDAVPMMRRTQYDGQRTEWHDLPTASQPHFLRDLTTMLDHVPGDIGTEPYKISLALHGMQIVTPWITVADGRGRFLSQIELQLTALGSELSSLRWETQYVDEEPPAHITVHTVWEHAREHDLESALALLFAVAAVLALIVLWITCAKDGEVAVEFLLGDDSRNEGVHRQHAGALHVPRRGVGRVDQPYRSLHRNKAE